MKKSIKYFLLFLLFVLVADQCIGYLSRISVKSMKSGFYGQINKAVQNKADVFILGSSRAQNHYNSGLFATQYGAPAFNAGAGGYGTFYSYALLKERIKKQKPKVVLLDIAPNILVDAKQYEKLSTLYPLIAEYSTFGEIVLLNPDYRAFPMFFQTYKYNSTLFDVFYESASGENKYDAFTPLSENLDKDNLTPFYYDESVLSKDAITQLNKTLKLQLDYVGKIKQLCNQNNIKLYCVISPSYIDYDKEHKLHKAIQKYFDLNKIESIDFTYSKKFLENEALYKDQLHLNAKGADIFTTLVIDSLKTKI